MLDNTFGKSLKGGISQDMGKQCVEFCEMAEKLDERYGRDSWQKDCMKLEEESMELTQAIKMLTRCELPFAKAAEDMQQHQFGHTAPGDMGLGIMIEGTAEQYVKRGTDTSCISAEVHKELSDVVAVVGRMIQKMSRATGIPFGILLRMYAGMAVDKMQHRQEDPMWDRGGCLKR